MKISFGMIFSIILIIAFLGFAFFAIQKILDTQNNVIQKKFYDSLGNDVNKIWKEGTSASKKVEYITPRGAKKLCFENDPSQNVYFYSDHSDIGELIPHLEINQDFCIEIVDSKVSFILVKTSGDPLVKVNSKK